LYLDMVSSYLVYLDGRSHTGAAFSGRPRCPLQQQPS
jgi:hypothetical protein